MIEPRNIMFVSHTARGGSFKVGSHHLSECLAAAGHSVTHLSTPRTKLHNVLGRQSPKLPMKLEQDSVNDIVPTQSLPAQLSSNIRVRRLIERIDPEIILIDQPLLINAVPLWHRRLIYRPTDFYLRGVAANRQAEAIRRAHAIVATSDEVLRRLRAPSDVPKTVITNGVSSKFLESPLSHAERSGVIYVGAMDRRFDWDAVHRMAEVANGEPVELHGPVSVAPRKLPSNVHLRGALKYDDLLSALNTAKVGILPFNSNPLNMGRSPMKLFEYLSAGLHVVSAAIPAVTEADYPGLFVYESADDIQTAMSQALDAAATPNILGRAVAEAHSWDAKSSELLDFVTSL